MDVTSIFSVVFDVQKHAFDLNNDLEIISEGTDPWERTFNPDLSKQA